MRALVLLAAITMMHTVHALPRQDLAVRQDDLSNDRHVFHHLDRNPRTANRNREHADRGKEEGTYVDKRLADRVARERRFMQGPDYSQGGGSDAAKSASNTTTATQQAEEAGETANSHS